MTQRARGEPGEPAALFHTHTGMAVCEHARAHSKHTKLHMRAPPPTPGGPRGPSGRGAAGAGAATTAGGMVAAAPSTSRFAHLLQPIRDLAANWDVDLASELEEYLVCVCV